MNYPDLTCAICGKTFPHNTERGRPKKTCGDAACRSAYRSQIQLGRGTPIGQKTRGGKRVYWRKKNGKYLHIWAAEEKLGRVLQPNEIVLVLRNRENPGPGDVEVYPSRAAWNVAMNLRRNHV